LIEKKTSFDNKKPFEDMNGLYSEAGRLVIRSDGGWLAFNFADIDKNQMVTAKLRVRNSSNGRVAICLTQHGDERGVVAWIGASGGVEIEPSMFAKDKPSSMKTVFQIGDLLFPNEEWNEVTYVWDENLFHLSINRKHIHQIDLTEYSILPGVLALSISAMSQKITIEMSEYSIWSIE